MNKNERYQIRKSSNLTMMVNELMRRRRFVSISELFRTLVREAWERLDQ